LDDYFGTIHYTGATGGSQGGRNENVDDGLALDSASPALRIFSDLRSAGRTNASVPTPMTGCMRA